VAALREFLSKAAYEETKGIASSGVYAPPSKLVVMEERPTGRLSTKDYLVSMTTGSKKKRDQKAKEKKIKSLTQNSQEPTSSVLNEKNTDLVDDIDH
jgi:hypothetical protein